MSGLTFQTEGLKALMNSLGGIIPAILQAILTSSTLIAAVRTSNLTKRWLAGETKFQVIDLNIKIQAVLVFISNFFFAVVRTGNGRLGFNGHEKGREGAVAGLYVASVFVPAVTLSTITRMHRRLDQAALANEKAFEEKSGIVEAKTFHGQLIKIHWSDVDSKAQLLLRAQAIKIYEDVTESGAKTTVKEIEDKLFQHYTPARAFAAGVVGKRSDEASWMELLGSLKHMDHAGKQRFAAQSLVLLLSFAILVGTYHLPPEDTYFDRILFSVTMFLYWTASSFVGLWYEKWALTISSGRRLCPKENLAKWGSWVFVQVSLLAFPVISIFRGQYAGRVLYAQILKPGVLLGAVHEFILNEAYITSQQKEAAAFTVPSWSEIEATIKTEELSRVSEEGDL